MERFPWNWNRWKGLFVNVLVAWFFSSDRKGSGVRGLGPLRLLQRPVNWISVAHLQLEWTEFPIPFGNKVSSLGSSGYANHPNRHHYRSHWSLLGGSLTTIPTSIPTCQWHPSAAWWHPSAASGIHQLLCPCQRCGQQLRTTQTWIPRVLCVCVA